MAATFSDDFEAILGFWTVGNGSELLEIVQKTYLDSDRNTAGVIMRLKDSLGDAFSTEEMAVGLQIIRGREELQRDGMLWAAKGLFLDTQRQQATNHKIVAHHARAFRGLGRVADICCGLGFDTAAIAKVVDQVVAVEADIMVAAFACHNLSIQGLKNCVVYHATAEHFLEAATLTDFDGLWVDPDRRTGDGTRVHRGSEYSPPLDLLLSLPFEGVLGIKVSPIFDALSIRGSFIREIIGSDRETREQVLWQNRFGPELSVMIVDKDFGWEYNAQQELHESVEALESGQVLVEPHNALRQSNKVNAYFSEIGATPLKGVPIAVADSPVESVAVRQYLIKHVVSFRPKEVNRYLKEVEWGASVTIKKCGLSDSVDAIRSKLKFTKKKSAAREQDVLFVLGVGSRKFAVFCERVQK